MSVGYVDNIETAHLAPVDAAVGQPGYRIVSYLNEESVGTVEVERELLEPIGHELVTSSLRKPTQFKEIGGRQDLTEPKLNLRGTFRAVSASKLSRVAEQILQPLARESDVHPLHAS